jgi:hypothetical protein
MGPEWTRTKRARWVQLHACRSRVCSCMHADHSPCGCSWIQDPPIFDVGCLVSLCRPQVQLPMKTATGEIAITYEDQKHARYWYASLQPRQAPTSLIAMQRDTQRSSLVIETIDVCMSVCRFLQAPNRLQNGVCARDRTQ